MLLCSLLDSGRRPLRKSAAGSQRTRMSVSAFDTRVRCRFDSTLPSMREDGTGIAADWMGWTLRVSRVTSHV
jgi:hypothetical protein